MNTTRFLSQPALAVVAIASLSLCHVWAFNAAGAEAPDSAITQRIDGCVVMDVTQATTDVNASEPISSDPRRLAWKFDLQRAETFVVQIVTSAEHANDNQSANVVLDKAQLDSLFKRTDLIEDGIVLESVKAVSLSASEPHAISIQSSAPVRQIRLVPQMYSKRRIYISSRRYYPEWLAMHQSPQKQAALKWFRNARFGMFIHWGVYSTAAGSWKGVRIEEGQGPKVAEWLMFAFQIPRDEYRRLAKQFQPDKSFAANIARLAKDTGMKYVVITAKHHDGFALFESDSSDFDVVDATPYEGDLIKELYDACRAEGLDFGVYYSHGNDWAEGADGNLANIMARNNGLGLETRTAGKNAWDPSPNSHAEYLESKAYPQVAELIKLLPDLRLIWFDGEGFITEEQAFRFYKTVYDLNPNIIVNRRIGFDFGDYVDAGDNKTPGADELSAKHFETCGTGNRSWGFKAHDHNWKSPHELLRNFVDIVSKGGNYLLNIGPDGKGEVPQPCVDNFREMGVWVHTNAEAIFGTTSWTTFREGGSASAGDESRRGVATPSSSEFWFSAKDDKVYAMSLAPEAKEARIRSLNKSAGVVANVRLLGSDADLPWSQSEDALEVDLRGADAGANGYALEITMR